MYKKQFIYFLAVFFCGIGAKAQIFEVGAVAGGAGYLGDLNQTKPLKISGISAGAFVKMNINPYWAFGLHYTYGKIKADDAESDNQDFRNRNLKFYTPLNEISLQVDFNFLEYFAGGGTKRFSPYIFTGIGGVFYNPKIKYNGEKYNLRSFETEDQGVPYKNYALTIPYGVGMKVQLKENWGLLTQIGYRTAYSDYLDDVSGTYHNLSSDWSEDQDLRALRERFSNPSGQPAGTQRGDFRKRDTYMFVGIGISYTFVSQKCYTF